MTLRYIKDLKMVRREDFDAVGGKAANLGEMLGAGLPVPGGFVVLTHAYRRFVSENRLEEVISSGLDRKPESPCEIEEVAEAIQSRFREGVMPQEVAGEIDRMYESLGGPVTAVRSSATAEDLPGVSFAGQYSSYLNISGSGPLQRAIVRCWASL